MEGLYQAQIDEMVRDNSKKKDVTAEILTKMEMDTIGEIGNISMGTSATTLSKLLNKTVNITTPRVSLKSMINLQADYPKPNVAMEIEYIVGLKGKNLLIIKEDDAKIITDLLMGGTGEYASGDLNEMHISAIGEVMNQMVGSSSTALADMFNLRIDISPPKTFKMDFSDDIKFANDSLVVVLFNMEIENVVSTDIMLMMPLDFAKNIISMTLGAHTQDVEPVVDNTPKPVAAHSVEQEPVKKTQEKKPVNVSRINYEEFGKTEIKNESRPLHILRDVPLELKVELGKTVKSVKDILSMNMGSIIELDRSTGDDVDIILNGRYIAKGEVVVVDNSYGVRITEILEG